jgi:hypothetical protein|tara:strand:+ start:1717 stop:3327 length:1611 start_codon:yes stop_codon:yes gene_type:complete
MFSNIFEERDRKISVLVKLGDCLGRSLRENVTLFSLDGGNEEVSYLTENDKIITGKYKIDSDVVLENIQVQDSSLFKDETLYDSYVSEKINTLIENIHYTEYSTADSTFSDLLGLWENRLKLENVQSKLYTKSQRLTENSNITGSDEFGKLIEITPQLVEFLKENKDEIITVPEIRNGITLSNTVAEAFDFPQLSYEDLEENKSYILKDGVNESIYEMICRQELVKRELLESKQDFEMVWASNGSVRKLASMIFESDEKIVEAMCEVLKEVPYLAIASKKALFETFSNSLADADGLGVSEKDIQKFASKIFEYKKEVKETFIQSLNEKYGVNIQNLQEIPSFKSLVNTQVVIFEALSRLAPKRSVMKQILSELSLSMKNKSGVESIDVNDYLQKLFTESAYGELLEATKTVGRYSKVDFKRVSQDLGDMKKSMDTLKDQIKHNEDPEYSSTENLNQKELAQSEKKAEKEPESPVQNKATPSSDVLEQPDEVAAEDAEGSEEESDAMTQDDVVTDISSLENMVSDITDELKNSKDKE